MTTTSRQQLAAATRLQTQLRLRICVASWLAAYVASDRPSCRRRRRMLAIVGCLTRTRAIVAVEDAGVSKRHKCWRTIFVCASGRVRARVGGAREWRRLAEDSSLATLPPRRKTTAIIVTCMVFVGDVGGVTLKRPHFALVVDQRARARAKTFDVKRAIGSLFASNLPAYRMLAIARVRTC